MSIVARLRELSGKATAQPWQSGNNAVWQLEISGEGNSPECICEYVKETDAELIALMRNNIDKILDVVEAAKEYMETDKFLAPEYGSKLRTALAALDEPPESKGRETRGEES